MVGCFLICGRNVYYLRFSDNIVFKFYFFCSTFFVKFDWQSRNSLRVRFSPLLLELILGRKVQFLSSFCSCSFCFSLILTSLAFCNFSNRRILSVVLALLLSFFLSLPPYRSFWMSTRSSSLTSLCVCTRLFLELSLWDLSRALVS